MTDMLKRIIRLLSKIHKNRIEDRIILALHTASRPMYGLEICLCAHLSPGSIQPDLARLEGQKYLESFWESYFSAPYSASNPMPYRRRYYRLTKKGLERVEANLGQ